MTKHNKITKITETMNTKINQIDIKSKLRRNDKKHKIT